MENEKYFGLISQIAPGNSSTWSSKLFITLDLDWAIDPVIDYCAELLVREGAAATWFITHQTPRLSDLQSNSSFETGLHPDFNPLLFEANMAQGTDARKIVEDLLEVVPGARSIRSHSLTENSKLFSIYREVGLSYECSSLIPVESGMLLRPYLHFSSLVKVSSLWEDDVHFSSSVSYPAALERITAQAGLTVVNFHPIHIFLNTEAASRWDQARGYYKSYDHLLDCRNTTSYGTRDFLLDLIKRFQQKSS